MVLKAYVHKFTVIATFFGYWQPDCTLRVLPGHTVTSLLLILQVPQFTLMHVYSEVSRTVSSGAYSQLYMYRVAVLLT